MTLVEAGARVAVVGLTNQPHLAQTVKDAKAVAGDGRLIPIVADLRRDADCQRIAAETIRAFGTIHVLFNNAGLGLQVIADYSQEDAHHVLGDRRRMPGMRWSTPMSMACS